MFTEKCEVVQSSLTLCVPMDCSLPGSSMCGISRQEYWSGVPLPSELISWRDSQSPEERKWNGSNASLRLGRYAVSTAPAASRGGTLCTWEKADKRAELTKQTKGSTRQGTQAQGCDRTGPGVPHREAGAAWFVTVDEQLSPSVPAFSHTLHGGSSCDDD